MLIRRIYNDYLMPGRWPEYRAFLAAAKHNGYRFVRHQEAVEALASAGASARLFFLRHDVDSDLAIARTMFSIEREMEITSTYYFRRCTADPVLMREITAFGSEVGYHYEELSDHIKARRLTRQEDILSDMEELRRRFLVNLKAFEAVAGIKVLTVASHGDWSNRALGLTNTALMDGPLRAAAGIKLEAYDGALVDHLDFRAADRENAALWHPASPIDAVTAHRPVVLVLVHPRQWQGAPWVRLRLDAARLVEELRYRLG